jgi:hypothetical protein
VCHACKCGESRVPPAHNSPQHAFAAAAAISKGVEEGYNTLRMMATQHTRRRAGKRHRGDRQPPRPTWHNVPRPVCNVRTAHWRSPFAVVGDCARPAPVPPRNRAARPARRPGTQSLRPRRPRPPCGAALTPARLPPLDKGLGAAKHLRQPDTLHRAQAGRWPPCAATATPQLQQRFERDPAGDQVVVWVWVVVVGCM